MALSEATYGLIGTIAGALLGSIGTYVIKPYLEKKKAKEAKMESQLKDFFSPMEVILTENQKVFDIYFKDNTTTSERIELEKTWIENFERIMHLITTKNELIPNLDEFEPLIGHIYVWKSEYHRVRIENKDENTPITGKVRGYPFPVGINEYVDQKVSDLKKELGIDNL